MPHAIKLNNDILNDSFYQEGNTMVGAMMAFRDKEKATHEKTIDLSIATFLTPAKDSDKAIIFDGEQKITWGETGIRMTNKIEISFNREDYDGDESVLLDGGYYEENMDISNPYVYLMGSSIANNLKSRFSYFIEKDDVFTRNRLLAERCSRLDETPVRLVYREKDGIKKAFVLFDNQNEPKSEVLKFMDVMNAVSRSSIYSEKMYRVSRWNMSQRNNAITFENEKDDSDMFTINWSDILDIAPTVRGGNHKVNTNKDMLVNTITELTV